MSTDQRYRQVVKLVTESPWAILPSKLEAIIDIVALRAAGGGLSDAEIEARVGGTPAGKHPAKVADVAVIPLYGTIVPKANLMTQISGGTSADVFKQQFLMAMADDTIGAIVLDVDSPGGQTWMIPETAALIRQNRGRKPILASANTMMASAAYWIGSQADDIAISPSGMAGSIGVIAAHQDVSAALEQEGVKTTLITAGKYKAGGHGSQPLSDDARSHIQDLVDGMYATFTLDVAKGRGVPVADVRNGYGEGRVLDAKASVKAGLVDRVATLEQTIARAAQLAAEKTSGGRAQIAAAFPGDTIEVTAFGEPPDPPPDPPDPEDVPPEAAESGLSFAAELRRTLGAVEAHVATARSFADVAEKTRLTGPKREQFEAIALSLGEASAVRDQVVALLEETDPTKPDPIAAEAVGSFLHRITETRGAVA